MPTVPRSEISVCGRSKIRSYAGWTNEYACRKLTMTCYAGPSCEHALHHLHEQTRRTYAASPALGDSPDNTTGHRVLAPPPTAAYPLTHAVNTCIVGALQRATLILYYPERARHRCSHRNSTRTRTHGRIS